MYDNSQNVNNNEMDNIQNFLDSDNGDRPIVPKGNQGSDNGDRPIIARGNGNASADANGDRPIIGRGNGNASADANGDRPIIAKGNGCAVGNGGISITENTKVDLNSSDEKLLNYASNRREFINGVIFIRTDCGEGSGFMLSKDGYAATNAHVVGDCNDLLVRFAAPLAPQGFIKAKVIARDTIHDLAIIKLDANEYYHCNIDDSGLEPEIGSEVALFGFPLGSRVNDDVNNVNISFTRGYVSSNQTKEGKRTTFLDIQAFHGNSGGPIVDLVSGKIIGMLVGGLPDEADAFIMMIPIQYLHELIKRLAGENN